MIPLELDRYYHIFNHANGDDNLFRESKNYEFFLKKYHLHLDPVTETIAWCLMPNHFHLLVRIKDKEEIASTFPDHPGFKNLDGLSNEKEKLLFISKQFSNFFNSSTKAFNKTYQRKGSLFLKNFKRKEITDDTYFKNLILYIHCNPVHHGFTNNIKDYPWTSFPTFIQERPELVSEYFDGVENYVVTHLTYKCDTIEEMEID